ncbi:AAA family ATPase [Brumimicrobium oceani]|uniref:Rad50/SbcC-type AAA domain-containing protein n=1 Tax=Brumimicrobium oceani TaxID=2100725 RepID=A0A2U2X396_9FLAO|nr:hypothetical protein [Brumimicrobium oceani]PWH82252.1 hypothetical protein DIT68_14200 [Brumimicrobium oceani]
MKKSSFILKDLSIRKMAGFPLGMKALNNLAANVNIITGPNASGKSSTARAIQELIWHNNTKGLSLKGSVLIDEDNWEIDVDSGRVYIEKNGNIDQFKGLPAKEGHQRYLLALHNFVEGNEKDLAKEIAKQSIGGFDLEAAQESLGYNSKTSIRSAQEYKRYELAFKEYRNVRENQKQLSDEEKSLSFLEEEKQEAQQAERRYDFYNKVAEYLNARLKHKQLKDQLNDFPESIRNLAGNENELIQDYENALEDCEIKIEKAKKEILESKREFKELTIPENGVSQKVIAELDDRIAHLSDLARNIQRLKISISGLQEKENNALKTIDPTITAKKWEGINIKDVGELDKMLQNANQVLGEKEFLLAEIQELEKEAKEFKKGEVKPEIFTQGIKTLSDWLKEPQDTKGVSLQSLVILFVLSLLTIVSTYFFGAFGLIGLLFIVAAFIFAYSKKGGNSHTHKVREQDFSRSGLKSPASWNTENVAHRIDDLIEKLSVIKETERITQRLDTCKANLGKLQSRIDALHNQRNQWTEKLQSAPGFPKENSNDFSSLYWFLKNIIQWQEAHSQRKALEAEQTKTENHYRDELNKINELFANTNFPKAIDFREAKGVLTDLKAQESTRKDLFRSIENNNRIVSEQEFLRKSNEDKLSGIYSKIGIDKSEKSKVQDLINQLVDFKKIDQAFHTENQVFSDQKRRLETHSLYEEHKEELKELTIDLAQEKAKTNKEIATKLEEINKKITTIETKIRERKKGNKLESLLTEKEDALDGLHQLYEKNVKEATGDLIIKELKKETQHKNRPEVFKRANEIFNRITLGRYELLLNERGDTQFRALDKSLNRGYNLSELSTGSRVQLLLAVRLAYVETVESTIKLPLLADELLANSDDLRAKAIIEALIEISRDGRQVFYFTAQEDEVGKWQSHLSKTQLESKIFRLNSDGNETLSTDHFDTEFRQLNFSNEVPSPGGKNHHEYRAEIPVPSYNLLTQNASELPLWYLIEEVNLLYSALKIGVKTWGQLESFYQNDGIIEELNEEKFKQFSGRIQILNRFQELYKIGRSLPIDRTVLQDSGAVSEAWIDRVSDKLNEVHDDPHLLLHALKNREVSGFRTNSIEELESYLMSENYIDDQEILEKEELMISIQALISKLDIDTKALEQFLKRILERT